MTTPSSSVLRWFLPGLVLCASVGCASNVRSYPGHEPIEVWTAMVGVAESPDYEGEWFVIENEVAADEAAARIDIGRTIRRTLYRPGAEPLPEQREWHFTVALLGGPDNRVEFTSHGWALPSREQDEMTRFFDDLAALLSFNAQGQAEGEPADDADEEATPADAADVAEPGEPQ